MSAAVTAIDLRDRLAIRELSDWRGTVPHPRYAIVLLEEDGTEHMVVPGSQRHQREAAEIRLRELQACPECLRQALNDERRGVPHKGSPECAIKTPHCEVCA